MNMNRLAQKLDFEAIFNRLGPSAVDEFNDRGKVPPRLMVVELREQVGEIAKVVMIEPRLLVAALNHERGDLYGQLLQALTQPGPMRDSMREQGIEPHVIVQIAEAWVGNYGEKHFEEIVQDLKQQGLESDPDRTEAVMVMMYTDRSTAGGMCPISEGRAKMGSIREGFERLSGLQTHSPGSALH
jgi:hypothetical protein